MDKSPLNAAHQQHRRAEASMRYRKYDEAIQCHERASEYLKEALKLTTSAKAIESINLQCDYHIKQRDLAISKREQFEHLKKNIEKQRLKMAAKNTQTDGKGGGTTGSLQTAINKTMDEADSIVEMLYRRNALNELNSGDNDSIDNGVVHCHNISDTLLVSGVKEPKNDNVVIEELQIVNQQLRTFINQLLTQLETSTQEADSLRSQVASLVRERNDLLGLPQDPPSPEFPEPEEQIPADLINDSLEEDTSPFIFSPYELSPGHEERELPALPPLELPEFDFEALMGQIKLKSEGPMDSNNLFK